MTVIPLQLSSGPCASESLGHTGFDPPSLSLSASGTRRFTFAHPDLSKKLLLLIPIPSHICIKQILKNTNKWTVYLGISS